MFIPIFFPNFSGVSLCIAKCINSCVWVMWMAKCRQWWYDIRSIVRVVSIYLLILISDWGFSFIGFSFFIFCSLSFWQIDEANVFKETKQFTYKDGSQFVFMDLVSSGIYIIWPNSRYPPFSPSKYNHCSLSLTIKSYQNSQLGLYYLSQ